MNVYKFETLNEFGYAKDPHRVFLIVRNELKSIHKYTVTDGFKEVPKADFRMYPVWEDRLKSDGEVYFELYGKRKPDVDRTINGEMLGIIKIEEFTTID